MLARQIRFTCPHCGATNRAPVRSIGRGGACVRCGGGIKVPSAHAASGAIEEVDSSHEHHDEIFEPIAQRDLIGDAVEDAADDLPQAADEAVTLFDLGRPASPTRSVRAPSAIVADATILPTAMQLASSDRAERSAASPVQTLRSLRRFAAGGRPRRHVAARRQPSEMAWWAWAAQGALSIGAIYILASVYNGSFNASVNADTSPMRFTMLANEPDGSDTASPEGMPPGIDPEAKLSTLASPGDEAVAELIARSVPDERIWIRYERILVANNRPLYAVVRVTQSRDGRIRVDRNETSERPTDFPEDATLIDRRPTTRAAAPGLSEPDVVN